MAPEKGGEAQGMAAQAHDALESVTGRSFDTAAAWRQWWNKRENRETFLRERLGK